MRASVTARLLAGLLGSLLLSHSVTAADDPAPVKLVIKPLLCVIDKEGASCAVTFDIRWRSAQPAEYCLSDSVQPAPLRCWARAAAGEHRQERVFSEDFRYWLSRPPGGQSPQAGAERLAEVKIEVLRLGSDDRRRERRSRHVWDVL